MKNKTEIIEEVYFAGYDVEKNPLIYFLVRCGECNDESSGELLLDEYEIQAPEPILFACWNCGNEEWLAIPEQEKGNVIALLDSDRCKNCFRNSFSCECE